MKIFRNIEKWREFRKQIPDSRTLGCVPTMGALHNGHISLVERSQIENDLTLVTIFLNPTQFNNKEDLEKYPRTWEEDVKALEDIGVDYLLAPDFEQMYPDNYNYVISEKKLSSILCGKTRPGHFDGVLTIVMKLFMLVNADKAYFGEKDYQQLRLIKGMTEAFFVNTKIISCPIIREDDGLAMSSRNARLTPNGRIKAGEYVRIIRQNKPCREIVHDLEKQSIKVDYLEEHFGRRFAAVFIDEIRLIDNFEVQRRNKMQRIMLKSKIHMATVTEANLEYFGSISICPELYSKADMLPFEKVEIYNCNNGERFSTYVIPGKKGEICLNGAAARLVAPKDKVIIASYAEYSDEEARELKPTLVFVDEVNDIKEIRYEYL